ncbi:MAG: hypothetical protein AMK72_13610 [Planctomycetes bacterium SM23_25]|nr:MAG: hypothetical protein AMK72_13610 [Planctomycetes bacterium SM23_25]
MTPIDDGEQESNETVVLNLVNGPGYARGTSVAGVTITDNDVGPPAVWVSVAATDASAAEQDGDPAEFTVTRAGPTDAALTVYYAVGGTAESGDYEEVLTGQVVIPAALTSVTIPITPVDDPADEPLETVVLTLTGHPTYGVAARTATVTIADNDDESLIVSIAASDPDAAEQGTDPGEFTVTRTGPTGAALTVYYSVRGSAGAGADYTPALASHVEIPAGQASATIHITPVDDAEDETDETVILTLTADPAYVLGTAEATVTIADNELPVVVDVTLNPHPARPVRGVAEIDPSGLGVKTVRVAFSEAVTFAPGDVTAEKVAFDALGRETSVVAVVPASVGGSGTNEMTITFADAWQTMVDTWVRITLLDTITDAHGHGLDGEPAADSAGLHYIRDARLDLSSGNGAAGGEAVFYVGSLRADLRGFGPDGDMPNGTVDSWDITGFTQKYLAGSLDADFRGFGPDAEEPNGTVNSWDINGFTSRYTQAIAAGTRLEDLPTAGGQGLAAAAPVPLPLLAADSPKESATSRAADSAPAPTGRPEAVLLAEVAAAPAPAGEAEPAASSLVAEPPPGRQLTRVPSVLQRIAAGEEPGVGRRAAAAWDVSPRTEDRPAAEDPLEAGDGLVDVLSLPALNLPTVL